MKSRIIFLLAVAVVSGAPGAIDPHKALARLRMIHNTEGTQVSTEEALQLITAVHGFMIAPLSFFRGNLNTLSIVYRASDSSFYSCQFSQN